MLSMARRSISPRFIHAGSERLFDSEFDPIAALEIEYFACFVGRGDFKRQVLADTPDFFDLLRI
jgi:hypothetical protein